jgi:asparagine synthase (glutamine-hydrolysing)
VLLNGQMGNMGFSWTGLTFLAEELGRGGLIQFARTATALHRNGTRWRTVASQGLGAWLPVPAWQGLMRWRGRGRSLADYSMINPAAADRLDVHERAAAHGLDLSYRPRRNGAAARLWALGRIDFGNYQKGMVAGWGIDFRDPTADQRLIEFCLRVPEKIFLLGGRERGLARAAMADRLPPEIASLRLKGYQGADWYEGVAAGRPQLEAELARMSGNPGSAAALDIERMRGLLDTWPAEGYNSIEVIRLYRGALLRGVSTGHFVRKAARDNN